MDTPAPSEHPDIEMRFDNALAFYGTLRPGESNHWVVRDISGRWVDGVIRGYVFEVTWSGYEGYPGFVPDPDGHRVPVSVLVSDEWDRHLARVDEFEGPGYERRPITVFGVDGADGDGADGDGADGDGAGGIGVIGEAAVYEFLTDRE